MKALRFSIYSAVALGLVLMLTIGSGFINPQHSPRQAKSSGPKDPPSDPRNSPKATTALTLKNPIRLTEGPAGQLLVSDYAGRQILFVSKADLSITGGFPVEGKPTGLAFDGTNIYVGNETTSQIEVFDLNGQCLLAFPDVIELPNDIAVNNATGEVYVTAVREKIVRVYTTGGTYLRPIPAPGQEALGNPVSIAYNRLLQPEDMNADYQVNVTDLLVVLGAWGTCPLGSTCPEDINRDGLVNVTDLLQLLGVWGPNLNPSEIYISDFGDTLDPFFTIRNGVKVYDEQGYHLRTIRGLYDRPQGVHPLGGGYFFMVDSFMGQALLIQESNAGTIATLGEYGSLPGQLDVPLDLFIDELTRDVFVTSSRTGTIEVFRQGGQLP